MARNSTAHPEAIANTIAATWWEDTEILEISASADDLVLLTVTGVRSRVEARGIVNRALGGLGQYVELND